MATLIAVGSEVVETVDEAVAAIDRMTTLGKALGATEPSSRVKGKGQDKDRLVIRFDNEKGEVYPGDAIRLTRPMRDATLLRYVEKVAFTPTGGRYISRNLLVNVAGKLWMGSMKKGTDVVRLRPAPADVAR